MVQEPHLPTGDLYPRIERGRRPAKCPRCGKAPVGVLRYGKPVVNDKLLADLAAGTVVLAGCMVYDDAPAWRCSQCGQVFHQKG